MSKQQLKPCPFCGGEAKVRETDIGGFYVYCTKCPCDFGRYWFVTKEQAIKAWQKSRVGEEDA